MITRVPTDGDVEAWFDRHRDEVADAAVDVLAAVAAWIPIVGLPANDDRAPTIAPAAPWPRFRR